MLPTLVRALALLQRYPVAFLLPTVLIFVAGESLNRALAGVALSKFAHFLVSIGAMFLSFLLGCVAFLCVADNTAKSEANRKQPKIENMLGVFRYPGCAHLLAGLLARFAFALVIAGAVTVFALWAGFASLRSLMHHPVPRSVSGPAYLWLIMVLSVVILSRWILSIPLFTQSEGMLKAVFAASVKAIQGRKSFAIVFTLFVQAVCYPLMRLTGPLHPRLSEGAVHCVPQLFEIIAAYGFQAVIWTWWMIVIAMLAMRLQGHDEPLPATPLAA